MESGNKNSLFLSDRQNRNAYDFEGSGVGNGRYDKNKEFRENIKNSILPIVLLIVTILFTVFFIKYASHYVYVINHYTKAVIEKDIYGGFEFRTPDGKAYKVAGDSDVYYSQDDYEKFEKVPKMYLWVLGIVIIITAYVLIIRSLYKTFHKTHHSEKRIELYDMDD